MMNTDSEWPEMAQELGRKATASIEKWASMFQAGKITKRELFIGITMIYETTSGILPEDVATMISQMDQELKSK